MVNKQELKYIAIAIAFAVAFFGYIIPQLINNGIEQQDPFIQFLIFNVGVFVFLQIFLKAITLGSSVKFSTSLGILLLFLGLDLIIPPLMVSQSGEIFAGATLAASSSDFIVATMWQSFGLSGHIIYILTYMVTPFIFLFIAAKLLPNFVRRI
jgi:hypothetical protein